MTLFANLKRIAFVALCTTALLSACKHTEELTQVPNEELGVSILTVNLLDLRSMPQTATGTDWRERYRRIGEWIQLDGNNIPDIVALQEAPGRTDCGARLVVPDYGALDFLAGEIRNATGEQYRIAYLITRKEGGVEPGAWFAGVSAAGCVHQGGLALLYRPSRVRNVIVAQPRGVAVAGPHPGYPRYTPLMSRSLQCCSTVPGARSICQFIDGASTPLPINDSDSSCPTPQGLAWTRVRDSMEGADKQKPQTDAAFSRFELVKQPGNYFHVYNVHRGFTPDTKDPVESPSASHPHGGITNINELITVMERRYASSANPTLYPPIVVGDLNFGANSMPPAPGEVTGFFPRFEVGMWGPENIGALFGLPSSFPAKQAAFAKRQTVIPSTQPGEACWRDPTTLVSDHCAISFRIEPTR
jgi:hypothetical protein